MATQQLHDAHVADWEEWSDAMDWNAACEQMRKDESAWEDNGCSWPSY